MNGGGRRFPWTGLMALGLGVLRLSPAEFWRSTPREILAAMPRRKTDAPDRAGLDRLMQRFPDHAALDAMRRRFSEDDCNDRHDH